MDMDGSTHARVACHVACHMGHGRVHARDTALSARCWRRRQAAWLRLAGHQTASELGGAVGGARRQGAIAAKKVAVLRRAVARLPQSERMRRALLRECEACLPADELQREWELQLRELPTALGLWAAYLESVARAFSSFSMPAYREAATRALAALAAPLERAPHGAPPLPPQQRAAMERGYLLLLLRLAHTERAAGFDERAVAMLQARCRDATPSTRVHMRAGAHRH